MSPHECNIFETSPFFVFLRQSPGIRATTWISEKSPKTHTPHQLTNSTFSRKLSWPLWAVWRRIRPPPRRARRSIFDAFGWKVSKPSPYACICASQKRCHHGRCPNPSNRRPQLPHSAPSRAANFVHDFNKFFSLGSVMPPCALYRDLTDEALWTVSRPACRVDGMPQPNRWSARTPGRKHRRPGR